MIHPLVRALFTCAMALSLLLSPELLRAESIHSILFGQDGKSKLDKDGRVPLPDVKKRLAEISRELDKNVDGKKSESLSKRLQVRQAQLIEYRASSKNRAWRRVVAIQNLRSQIAGEIEQLIDVLDRIQNTYKSIERHRIEFRGALKDYLEARKVAKKLIEKKYPIKKRLELAKLMKQIARRRERRRVLLNKIQLRIRVIDQKDAENRKQIRKLREDMAPPPPAPRKPKKRAAPKPKVKKRAAPKPKRRRRRTFRSRRRRRLAAIARATPPPPRISKRKLLLLEKKRKREERILQLAGILQRTRYSSLLRNEELLRLQKSDEELAQEIQKYNIYILSFSIYLMTDIHKLYAAKAKGGRLHRKEFGYFDGELYQKIIDHSTKLITGSGDLATNIGKQIWARVQDFQKKSGWVLLLLLLLVPLALLGLALLLRAALLRVSRYLLKRSEENEEDLNQFWTGLLLVCLVTYRLLLLAAVFGGLWIVVYGLDLPRGWARMLWTLGSTIIVLRAVWLLANQLLADDPKKRVLHIFDEKLTRRFRRTIKWLSGFALFYLPFLELIRVLGYPEGFAALLDVCFYFVIWFGAVISYMRGAEEQPPEEDQDDGEPLTPEKEKSRLSRIIGYRVYPVLLFIATGVFLTYALGYRNLATYVGRAMLVTLFIVSITSTLFQALKALVFWIFGLKKEGTGLIQVSDKIAFYLSRSAQALIGVVLGIFTLSLIMEAWKVPGGYTAVIKLLNTPFLQVKGTRLSLLSIVKFVLVFGGALWLSGWVKRKLNEKVYPSLRTTTGTQHAINTVLGYAIIIVGALAGLQVMGMSIGVLAVFAGVIGIGVGFGLQNIMSNFISGLIITFGRPVAVGDVIEVGGVVGVVRDISANRLTLETVDSRIILVPNSEIVSSQVINWSLGPPFVWLKMGVGVAYGSDVKRVKEALLEVAQTQDLVLKTPAPKVLFTEFNSSSLDFLLLVAVKDPTVKGALLSELRFATNAKFDELGIEMPFPQRDIHLDTEVSEAVRKVGDYIEQLDPKPT